MEADTTIGQRIKSRRIDRGLTRDALAAELEREPADLIAWEEDEDVPGPEAGSVLARALGTTAAELGLESEPARLETEWPDLPTEAGVVPGTAGVSTSAAAPSLPSLDDPPVPPRLVDQPTLAVADSDDSDVVGRFPVVRRVLPPSLRRMVATDYRESERRTYWVRFTLTSLAIAVMFLVMVWATGEFLEALGDAFASFSDEGLTTTTVAPVFDAST